MKLRLTALLFVLAGILITARPVLAAAPDEFGRRFSETAPAALQDAPDMFADFLSQYEPSAGGSLSIADMEKEPPRKKRDYSNSPTVRAPRLSGDNSPYLVRKRSGE